MPKRKYSSHSIGSKAYTTFKGINKGSTTHKILDTIARYTHVQGSIRYNEIKTLFMRKKNYTSMGLDRTLRRLETSGMVTRPKTGYYTITRKGRAVLYDLMKFGSWRK